ncbi:hypothetical protein M0804_014944 [Polistes exclamans]|nr:hypothetical protein M0804_014944 [Polistes exclamans]
MENCKRVSTPLKLNIKLMKTKELQSKDEILEMKVKPYIELIGNLIYLCKRLMQRDEANLDTTYDDGTTALETPATEGGEVESLRRQVGDLMREVEQLRGTPEQRPRVSDRHREVNLSVISDMIDVFDGSVGTFTVWERRVRYIQRMH